MVTADILEIESRLTIRLNSMYYCMYQTRIFYSIMELYEWSNQEKKRSHIQVIWNVWCLLYAIVCNENGTRSNTKRFSYWTIYEETLRDVSFKYIFILLQLHVPLVINCCTCYYYSIRIGSEETNIASKDVESCLIYR